MKPFPVKSDKLDVRGFDNRQVVKIAQDFFKALMHKTKRQLYIRSAYFGKKKIFFTYFWKHLYQKSPRQRRIRIVYLPCAIELIQKCRHAPAYLTSMARFDSNIYSVDKDLLDLFARGIKRKDFRWGVIFIIPLYKKKSIIIN